MAEYEDWQFDESWDDVFHDGEEADLHWKCKTVDGLDLYTKIYEDAELTEYIYKHPDTGETVMRFDEDWGDDCWTWDRVLYQHYCAGLAEKAEVIAREMGLTLKFKGRKLYRYLKRKYWRRTHVWWHSNGLHYGLRVAGMPTHSMAEAVEWCHAKCSGVEAVVLYYELTEDLIKWGILK